MANQMIIPRQSTCFLKKETTRGTLVAPAAADTLVLAGPALLNQVPTYTDSEEIANTRDVLDQFADVIPAGEWSLTTYLRPSGTAGTAPAESALWEGVLGTCTDGASDVVYTPALVLPSYSLWVKESNVVLFASGCSVAAVELTSDVKGAVRCDWSGKFLRLGWCGETTTAEAIDGTPTPDASVVLTDARVLTVGARIAVGAQNNSGNGYEVTAVNYATNTITVSPSFNFDANSGAAVTPVIPTASIVGEPVAARDRALSVATVDTAYKSFRLRIENTIEVPEEVSSSAYPLGFAEDVRRVSGSFSTIFRTADLTRFQDALGGDTVALSFAPASSVAAGDQVTFAMTKVRLQTPRVSTAGVVKQLDTEFVALATSGEDSITVTFA